MRDSQVACSARTGPMTRCCPQCGRSTSWTLSKPRRSCIERGSPWVMRACSSWSNTSIQRSLSRSRCHVHPSGRCGVHDLTRLTSICGTSIGVRASTSSFSSSMPRSVGTSEPSSSMSRPLSMNGSADVVLDPARRDALEDAQPQEHLLEVGVARDRAPPRPRRAARLARPSRGTPRAGGRSTSGDRRGRSARRRRDRGTAGRSQYPRLWRHS